MRAARKALRGATERHAEGVPRWRGRSYLSVSVKTEKHTLAFSVLHREVLIRWHFTASLVRGLSFSCTAGRCPSPALKAGRWRGPGTRSAAATLDACRALLADHLSYGDCWGNPLFACTLRCASAGAYQLTENWCGPGESDWPRWVLTRCDFCPTLKTGD
ncbi:unnamed protein product [Pleuronectes platessa]|uniref:Uncharacterized protein n=1 Tax=Pleuronectes platessa TaxID=8262 RepID=A0A9N7TWJ8_PLEPL|nr:unnamed protein product [Pleuronectes platessa]